MNLILYQLPKDFNLRLTISCYLLVPSSAPAERMFFPSQKRGGFWGGFWNIPISSLPVLYLPLFRLRSGTFSAILVKRAGVASFFLTSCTLFVDAPLLALNTQRIAGSSQGYLSAGHSSSFFQSFLLFLAFFRERYFVLSFF